MGCVMQELELYTTGERRRAERQRSPFAYVVWDRYDIIEGHIRAIPPLKTRRHYFPMGSPSVLSEFARVTPGDERKCLAFVKRWGLLGYDDLATGHPEPIGDPVEWIWAHVNGVRAALDLRTATSDEDRLAAYLEGLVGLKVGQGRHVVEWPKGFERATAPLTVFGMIVNPNLRGFHREVSDSAPSIEAALGGGRYHNVFRWDALICVIYEHLADVLVGHTVRICVHCDWPFVPTHARQNFCPGSWNPRLNKRERSLCEQRYTAARRRREGKKS